MGPNKTDKAIIRASKASAGVASITQAFDTSSKLHNESKAHSKKSSFKDEMSVMSDLRKLRPFQEIPGRSHNAFQNMEKSITHGLNYEELLLWLARHKNQLAMGVLY